MEIITDKNSRADLLSYLKDYKGIVGRVGVGGAAHEGHAHVYRQAKNQSDILIIDCAKWIWNAMGFYRDKSNDPEKYFSGIIDSLKNEKLNLEKVVDYVVFTEINDDIWKQVIEFNSFKDRCFELIIDLGLNNVFSQTMIQPIIGDTELIANSYIGPKNILPDIVSRKIVGEKTNYHPNYIWSFYRNPNSFYTESRTTSDELLGKVIKEVYNEICRGETSFEKLDRIWKDLDLFMLEPRFSIIDLTEVKKVNELTDNCAIVFSESKKADYIFIKDGKMIF